MDQRGDLSGSAAEHPRAIDGPAADHAAGPAAEVSDSSNTSRKYKKGNYRSFPYVGSR